ncbi:MAG TPA: hypothetical protein VK395_30600 [Gemmataceae bacterium]|nr:hypothetical protein [Gemmataceae bacterium]
MRAVYVVLNSSVCLLGLLLSQQCQAGDKPARASHGQPQRVVIPFDFESKFDNGQYGQTIGDMIWKKLERQGGFVIPESMQDVRDWSQRTKTVPNANTPLEKMKKIVRDEHAGDIGIWGKVERVSGHEIDIYDLWIYVADFSSDPVKMIYEKKVRTETVSEIPHTYVKEALDRLYRRLPQASARADPAVQTRWDKNPNLVAGDFEKGKKGPQGWDPLPQGVSWVIEEGAKVRNRIIRFTIPQEVAETTGVLFYSDYFPVEEGATYRFACRWRTTGPAVKVFIKCYDELQAQERTKSGGNVRTQRREVYRSQQNLSGKMGTWNVHKEDFTPTHTQFTPRWGRVLLYGYYPAGKVEWDDIVVKQIVPAPPKKDVRDQRPSLETKARTQEIKDPR